MFLVGDREPTGQSDGGGFGPPPPSVPFLAPGEGGGVSRFSSSGTGGGGGGGEEDPTLIEEATCGARDALGEAGTPLDPACSDAPGSAPGRRGTLREAVGGTVTALGLGDGDGGGGGERPLKRSGR